MINTLSWDSEFFGIKVGELFFNGDTHLPDPGEYDLLYVISDKDHALKLKGFDNSFSEEKVKFQKKITSQSEESTNVYSCKDLDFSIDDIYQLAYESGKHSRFSGDGNFASGKFEELYRKWIDNSISHGFATDVLLFVTQNEPIGLLTYKIKEDTASVGLLAVSPKHQGIGIGAKLLRHLESVLYSKRVKSLIIPTQSENEAACKFYAKAGYEITERQFVKHYWKINDPIQ